eukprot:7303329-Prymnesium_polylepis.1
MVVRENKFSPEEDTIMAAAQTQQIFRAQPHSARLLRRKTAILVILVIHGPKHVFMCEIVQRDADVLCRVRARV